MTHTRAYTDVKLASKKYDKQIIKMILFLLAVGAESLQAPAPSPSVLKADSVGGTVQQLSTGSNNSKVVYCGTVCAADSPVYRDKHDHQSLLH